MRERKFPSSAALLMDFAIWQEPPIKTVSVCQNTNCICNASIGRSSICYCVLSGHSSSPKPFCGLEMHISFPILCIFSAFIKSQGKGLQYVWCLPFKMSVTSLLGKQNVNQSKCLPKRTSNIALCARSSKEEGTLGKINFIFLCAIFFISNNLKRSYSERTMSVRLTVDCRSWRHQNAELRASYIWKVMRVSEWCLSMPASRAPAHLMWQYKVAHL